MKRNPTVFPQLFLAVCLVWVCAAPSNAPELDAARLIQTAPIRMGDGASRLTDADIAEIELIIQTLGSNRPWLLEGPIGQGGGSIRAYLPADVETEDIRRGATLTMVRQPGETFWSAVSVRAARPGFYAQVRIPGRDFNTLTGEDDLNRPFAVSGTFDSAELVSLVKFIRTSPGEVQGGWPIQSVFRRDDGSIDVQLHQVNGSAIMMVRLNRSEAGWIIASTRTGRA